MKASMKSLYILPIIVATASIFTGCASNIEHIPTAAKSVEKQKAYNSSIDKVWAAAQRALSENDTFKVLDKSSGIMVTEFRPIDAKELSLAQTYFLGKTYKSSYTLNFTQNGANSTDVRVNVKLQAVQMVLLAREENNDVVAGYLRQQLFDKISVNLR